MKQIWTILRAGLYASVCSLLLGLSTVVQAETLVLIPGFQSQGMDWRFTQVSAALQSTGWVDGGNYRLTPQGISNPVQLAAAPQRVFYTVDLPTQGALERQADVLDQYLRLIYAQRREALTLAGHSAGGVVGRLWLVRSNRVPVKTLVTIASPHLGTPWAEVTEVLAATPLLDLAKSIGFQQLPDSKVLYAQLREERPGTFLYWLNHQPHPPIRYISLVRSNKRPDQADVIVPPYSQRMDKVFALQNRAEVWEMDGAHFLGADDGYALAHVLEARP